MSVELNDEAIAAMFADPVGPIAKIIEGYAYKVEAAAKSLLLIPGSGRLYEPGEYFLRRGSKIYHWVRSGPPHRASAAGEPPASDTGFLLNSITHQMGVDEKVYATVGSSLKYAIWLELGTKYMAPRPFLRPALDIGLKS